MAELKQLILDVRKPQGQIITVYGRQGDTNIQRELVIQDGGDPYDMEGKHIVFECMRPDGCFVSTSEGIGENKGNATFDVTIPVQATAVAGLVGLCFYKIVKDDGTPFRDTTATFELSLERDVDTNAEPGNYDDKLQEAQNTITDLLKKWEEQQQTQESDYAEALKKLKEDIDAAVKATESEARETFTAAEADRQQTFEAAEATRNNAETERAKAETAREEASKQAVDAAEAATTAATDAASTATTAATDANAAAAAANDAADEAEAALASINNTQAAIDDKEAERQANEQTRISNEEGRVAAEAAREEEHAKHNEQQAANNAAQTANDEAQAANDTAQAKNNADQAANNLAAQGRLTKILKEGEYDPETRVPTIEGDLTHVFAVPTAEAEAARILLDKAEETYKTAMADAGGEGPQFDGQITVAQTALEEARTAYEASNKYVEWLWILDEETGEGSWELYGNGNATLPDPITTDEIDKMWAGEPVETKHFQQSAGTAYNISKTKEAIAGAKTELNGTIDEVSQSLGALTTTVMNNQKAAVEKDSAQDDAIKKAQDAADAVDADLDRALEAQTTRDADQDTAIEEAKAAADAAAKAIPPTVSKTAPGVVPALPADASSDKLYAMGADAEGVGQWYEVKATGGGLDPRELRETIAAVTKIHDEAHSDTQADPLLHSWQNTQEAITALQAAIDKAKAVSDGCFQTVFTQAEVDAAKRELDQALETFKRTGTEALPNYEAYEALKKRVEEVNTSTTSSADGKDVPFGSKYVLVSDKATVDKALQTAEASINAATKQSQIDAAVSTLGTAVAAYEGAVKTATANTAALDQAIADAEAAKKDVAVSVDGSDLPAGSRYVEDQATLDALTQAITAATEAKSSATTQAQIDSATSTLTAATKEFNGKVQQNLKIPQSSEELEAMSWEEIAQLSAVAAEDPTDFLFMTDANHKLEKTITMTGISTVTTVKARIIGVGQDLDEAGNKLGLTFQLCDGLAYNQPVNMRMNASNTTSGGWQNSEMRSTNLPKIEAALPADLKGLLKTVKKKTNMASSGSTMTETTDKLALLSCVEVFGPEQSNYGSNQSGYQSWYPQEGEWYQWYKNHNTDGDRVIKRADGSAHYWWLRSVQSSSTFARVNYTGNFYWNSASSANLPCACFCV